MIKAAFAVITDLEILGAEHIPKQGPLIVVANHFSFIDPVAMIRVVPRHLEFVGGTRMPNAPGTLSWITKVWGYYPVHRGGVSLEALRAAEAVIEQGGVLGIFPEAGNWAQVLRPARPGTAFLAARTRASVLPIGMDGLTEVFPRLRRMGRAKVRLRIGEPMGPFGPPQGAATRREHLKTIGEQIMARIASLLPPERRGHFSEDPAIRRAARGTEIYPWDENPEV
jgi:1-acyl-sn-glycerol-3-phosphate acyltransferase